MTAIKYDNAGNRYRIIEAFSMQTAIIPPNAINETFISLTKTGLLTIKKGFCWNGANFAFDTANIMKGSCVHDALCELFEKRLITKANRKDADRLFRDINKRQGMWWVRVKYTYQAVRRWFEIAN